MLGDNIEMFEAEEMLKLADLDGDGFVSFEEFLEITKPVN